MHTLYALNLISTSSIRTDGRIGVLCVCAVRNREHLGNVTAFGSSRRTAALHAHILRTNGTRMAAAKKFQGKKFSYYFSFPTHAQLTRQVVRFPARKSKVIFNNVEENEHYLKAAAAAAAAKVPSGFSSLQDELLVPSTANYRHHHFASQSDVVVVGFLRIRHPLSSPVQSPELVRTLLPLPRWRSLWPQAIFIYETKNSPFLFRRPTSGNLEFEPCTGVSFLILFVFVITPI